MLQKSKSKQVQLVRYALLIPLVFGMLIYSSCSDTGRESIAVLSENPEEDQLKMIIESLDTAGKLNNSEKEEMATYLLDVIKANVQGQNVPPLPIKTSDFEVEGEVPFSVIDQVPIFPGCEDGSSNEERKKCMTGKISSLVAENFNIDLAKTLNLSGIINIAVYFKIDNLGNIVDAKARAPHPELVEEAMRVVNMLPKMTPGKQKGKAVAVPYYLPIKFEINE